MSFFDLINHNDCGCKQQRQSQHYCIDIPQGPRGERGPMGPAGRDGCDGKDGRPGHDGKDGRDGRTPTVCELCDQVSHMCRNGHEPQKHTCHGC